MEEDAARTADAADLLTTRAHTVVSASWRASLGQRGARYSSFLTIFDEYHICSSLIAVSKYNLAKRSRTLCRPCFVSSNKVCQRLDQASAQKTEPKSTHAVTTVEMGSPVV